METLRRRREDEAAAGLKRLGFLALLVLAVAIAYAAKWALS